MAAVAPIAAAFPCARSATRPSAGAAAPVVALGGRSAFPSTVQLPQRRRRVVAAAKKSSAPEVEAAAFNTEEVLQTLKEKWDATENKTSVALYAGGAFAALWASSTLVSIVNAVPLVRADAKAASRRLGGVSVSVRRDRRVSGATVAFQLSRFRSHGFTHSCRKSWSSSASATAPGSCTATSCSRHAHPRTSALCAAWENVSSDLCARSLSYCP
jgi:hypothetical protein